MSGWIYVEHDYTTYIFILPYRWVPNQIYVWLPLPAITIQLHTCIIVYENHVINIIIRQSLKHLPILLLH